MSFTLACRGSTVATAQKIKFSIEDFFSKCDQIGKKLEIWSQLLNKSLMENFIFCAVSFTYRPSPRFTLINRTDCLIHHAKHLFPSNLVIDSYRCEGLIRPLI